jgi:magnesium transporter
VAFITGQALITVRKDDGLDIGAVVQRWDEDPDLVKFGVGYLLYGLLDYIVDGQFEAVQSLDDCMEELEDRLFTMLRAACRSSGAASSCVRAWCCCAGS